MPLSGSVAWVVQDWMDQSLSPNLLLSFPYLIKSALSPFRLRIERDFCPRLFKKAGAFGDHQPS